jgi:hypothetical protein
VIGARWGREALMRNGLVRESMGGRGGSGLLMLMRGRELLLLMLGLDWDTMMCVYMLFS